MKSRIQAGVGRAWRRLTATVPAGSTRGRLPEMPPPVMLARAWKLSGHPAMSTSVGDLGGRCVVGTATFPRAVAVVSRRPLFEPVANKRIAVAVKPLERRAVEAVAGPRSSGRSMPRRRRRRRQSRRGRNALSVEPRHFRCFAAQEQAPLGESAARLDPVSTALNCASLSSYRWRSSRERIGGGRRLYRGR